MLLSRFFGKHQRLTSHSGFSPSDNCKVDARIATWSDSFCRIRKHSQPNEITHYADGNMESSLGFYILFDFCRMTRNALRMRITRLWIISFINATRTPYQDYISIFPCYKLVLGRWPMEWCRLHRYGHVTAPVLNYLDCPTLIHYYNRAHSTFILRFYFRCFHHSLCITLGSMQIYLHLFMHGHLG